MLGNLNYWLRYQFVFEWDNTAMQLALLHKLTIQQGRYYYDKRERKSTLICILVNIAAMAVNMYM